MRSRAGPERYPPGGRGGEGTDREAAAEPECDYAVPDRARPRAASGRCWGRGAQGRRKRGRGAIAASPHRGGKSVCGGGVRAGGHVTPGPGATGGRAARAGPSASVGRGAGALGARAPKSGAPGWSAGRCKISGELQSKTVTRRMGLEPAMKSSFEIGTT